MEVRIFIKKKVLFIIPPKQFNEEELIKHNVSYLEKNVVVHSDIVTSNGPDGAEDFGLALLNLYL